MTIKSISTTIPGHISLVLFVLLSSTVTFASAQQSGSVSGKLLDSTGQQSLQYASVSLLNPVDSALLFTHESLMGGTFSFTGIPLGYILLHVSFEGYKSLNRIILLSATHPTLDLGNLYMKPQISRLSAVHIQAPPIVLKGDTIEYNAERYKTRPNGNAADLVNELPGVQVHSDGSIDAGGERINQILLDGKPFFSGDINTALKTLPAEIIDKVQVYGAQNDRTSLTGFDDGSRTRTINITIKNKYRNSASGQGELGAGSGQTFLVDGNYQRLKGKEQFFLNGDGNNEASENPGVNTLWKGGLNYQNSTIKDRAIQGSYQLTDNRDVLTQETLIQNIYPPDSTTLSTQHQRSDTRNQSQNINFNMNQKVDSLNILAPRLNMSLHTTNGEVSSQTQLTGGTTGNPIYDATAQNDNVRKGQNIQAGISFIHKANGGRDAIIAALAVTQTGSKGSETNQSLNAYDLPTPYTDTINQRVFTTLREPVIQPSLTYMRRITAFQHLELNYAYSFSNNSSSNQTYRYDATTGLIDLPDSSLSNRFLNDDRRHQVKAGYFFQKNGFLLSLEETLQAETLNDKEVNSPGTAYSKAYTTLNPNIRVEYNISKRQHLNLVYSSDAVMPDLQQLHPLITTIDSLDIQTGNPNLKEAITRKIAINYKALNPGSGRLFFLTLDASTTQNSVQEEITQLPNGAQMTMPVNLSGMYSLGGLADYAIPRSYSSLEFTGRIRHTQNATIVDQVTGYTRNTQFDQTTSWKIHIGNYWNALIENTVTYNNTGYTLHPTQKTRFYKELFSGNFDYYPRNGWQASLKLGYLYNSSLNDRFQSSTPLVCPSLSRLCFKNKAGEIKIFVFDALDKNVSVGKTASVNTITESQASVRQRYVMLSFTYHLKPRAYK